MFVRVYPGTGRSWPGSTHALHLRTSPLSGRQAFSPYRGGAALKTLPRPEPFPLYAKPCRRHHRGVLEVLGPLGSPPRIRDAIPRRCAASSRGVATKRIQAPPSELAVPSTDSVFSHCRHLKPASRENPFQAAPGTTIPRTPIHRYLLIPICHEGTTRDPDVAPYSSFGVIGQEFAERFDERRQVVTNGVPDNGRTKVPVGMHGEVAQIDHLPPWDF